MPPVRTRLSRCSCLVWVATALAAASVPTPESVIGHRVGEDFRLARWETIVTYFESLGQASDRVQVRRIGTTTEGRPFLLVEISGPETIRQLERYRALQHRLADPRLIADDAERQRVLREAKATVIITCSLHSTEVAASQMSMELAYELATRNDPEVREILENCIVLLVPCANPDGLDKVIDWYERWLGTPYEGGPMPWLYQKYAGHDNNRDWFMLNLTETRIVTRVLYHEWFPTILYDIHQMGNRGPRFFVPPFFDPVNPNVDPLIHQSLLIIGGHMATELAEAGKTGVVFKAIYDNWWQGGNRTTPYRHNVVGILTEAASVKIASPVFQEYHELRGGRRGMPQYAPAVNFPEPWPGGWWRLRDIVEYEKIATYALLRLSARYRDRFVANHLRLSEKALRLGREQPPYAWLVPPGQRDPSAAAHMLEVLRLSGIEIHRATEPFEADGAPYPAGTYVLLAAQPYRNHLKDMMERQQYPDRRQYPGGPAEPPYDVAGWTLPLQMGVRSVEVVSAFDAKLERVEGSMVAYSMFPLPKADEAAGWAIGRSSNADAAAIWKLLSEGYELYVLKAAIGSAPHGGQPLSTGIGGQPPSAGIGGQSPSTGAPHSSVASGLRARRDARATAVSAVDANAGDSAAYRTAHRAVARAPRTGTSDATVSGGASLPHGGRPPSTGDAKQGGQSPPTGRLAPLPAGTVLVRGGPEDGTRLAELGMAHLEPVAVWPDAQLLVPLRKPRVGLYQPWTANMDEGWTRFVLDSFGFEYATVHNAEIRAGGLRQRYDCLIIPDMPLRRLLDGYDDKTMPPPYAGGIGLDGAMQLERFVRSGGTLVLMDSACELATRLWRVPVRNVLDGLPQREFFCPGSILRIRLEPREPIAYGFGDEAAAYFARSQAFVTGRAAYEVPANDRNAQKPGGGDNDAHPALSDAEIDRLLEQYPTRVIARYSENVVLLSGYLLGAEHLRGKAAVVEVQSGQGRIVLLGFRVQHRGQSWGTFRLLFNAILEAGMR